MSSPSGRSEETRSQDSVHASSQFAAGTGLEDTASSVHPTLDVCRAAPVDSNESSAQRCIYARDVSSPSALRISGATTVALSLRLVRHAT